MKLFEWILSPRSQKDWQSWWALLITLPWVIGLLLLVSDGRNKADIASREATAIGTITEHNPSNHNECRYRFTVRGRLFEGGSSCRTENVVLGSTTTVYFDAANPTINSLEEYDESGRNSLGPCGLIIAGILSFVGAIAYQKWVLKMRQKRHHDPDYH